MKLVLVSIGRYGPSLFIHPKWVQLAKELCSYDVIKTCRTWNCDFLRKIGKNSKFRYKSSEYQNFPGFFCLYKRKVVIPTCSVSFSIIVCRYFSKWWIKMSKNWKRLHPPPTLWLWQLTLPRVRWNPQFFFHENDHKGCKRDYLYALGNFL